jgi:sulfate permease, SulP family
MSTRRAGLDRHELAGGLGDAGLFLPIAVALIAVNGLNATAVFAVGGLAYLGTAYAFRVPVPVQPLKAFAAAAIALELDAQVIAAGALLMSAAMALLAATGAAGWLAARFPEVLIRGIQMSVALLLCKASVELAEHGNWGGLPPVSREAGLATAGLACGLLFAVRGGRIPGTLLVLGGGLVGGLAIVGPPSLALGPEPVALVVPDLAAFGTALTTLVIAQLPLTFGNSVVATADAEREYFGDRARRVTPNRLAASIGATNLAAGLTAGLPLCHGAGGVTAHYKLGARRATATAFVGVLFVSAALLLGSSLPALVTLVMPGALAGMLLYVAIQHGLLAARLETLADRLIAIEVGLVTLFAGNLAIGFGAGVATLLLRRWLAGLGEARSPRVSLR